MAPHRPPVAHHRHQVRRRRQRRVAGAGSGRSPPPGRVGSAISTSQPVSPGGAPRRGSRRSRRGTPGGCRAPTQHPAARSSPYPTPMPPRSSWVDRAAERGPPAPEARRGPPAPPRAPPPARRRWARGARRVEAPCPHQRLDRRVERAAGRARGSRSAAPSTATRSGPTASGPRPRAVELREVARLVEPRERALDPPQLRRAPPGPPRTPPPPRPRRAAGGPAGPWPTTSAPRTRLPPSAARPPRPASRGAAAPAQPDAQRAEEIAPPHGALPEAGQLAQHEERLDVEGERHQPARERQQPAEPRVHVAHEPHRGKRDQQGDERLDDQDLPPTLGRAARKRQREPAAR